MKRFAYLLGVAAIVSVTATAQRTVPLTLRDMVRKAGTIVHATVTRVETGKDPASGSPATWVTLSVVEDFYGAPSRTFTFMQYGGEVDGLTFVPAGMPRYRTGDEVVLLLGRSAPGSGFQATIGLGQGTFVVQQAEAPRKQLVEQVTSTPSLFKYDGSARDAGGALALDVLSREIRTLVREEKGAVK